MQEQLYQEIINMFGLDTLKIEKSSWPDGEWKTEPDLESWADKETGYSCIVKRSSATGALCGYVICKSDFNYDDSLINIDVHGGITFNDVDSKGNRWIGFDCSHCYDFMPKLDLRSFFGYEGTYYRNFQYVKSEVESMARQIKELEK